jgi:hypothetical protein
LAIRGRWLVWTIAAVKFPSFGASNRAPFARIRRQGAAVKLQRLWIRAAAAYSAEVNRLFVLSCFLAIFVS